LQLLSSWLQQHTAGGWWTTGAKTLKRGDFTRGPDYFTFPRVRYSMFPCAILKQTPGGKHAAS
jgi:hypothetical protein